MAGVNVTLGVDGADYAKGLNRALKEADDFSRGWSRAIRAAGAGNLGKLVIGDQILKRSFQASAAAIQEFAKDNADAQAVLARWDAIGNSIQRSIGQDLVAGLEASLPLVQELADGAERIRKSMVDGLSNLFAGDPYGGSADRREIRAAEAANAESSRSRTAFNGGVVDEARLNADRAKAAGDDLLAQSGTERARYLAARQTIGMDQGLSQPDKDKRYQAEQQRHAANVAAIERQKQAKEEKEYAEVVKRSQEETKRAEAFKAEQAKMAAESQARVQRMLEDNQIERMQVSEAAKAEVEYARVRLDYERQIAEVRMESGLTPDQKAAYAAQIGRQRDELIAAMAAEDVTSAQQRVADAMNPAGFRGLSSAGIFGRTLTDPGIGFRVAPAETEMSKAQKDLRGAVDRQTRVLEDIKRNTAQGTVARAG